MTDRLKGKLAFCTASGAGIGRATAMAFAREGAKVIATDINEAAMAGLREEGVAERVKLDARDTAAVEELAKRLGPVDMLFNAAGFVHHGTVLDCTDEEWDFAFDLNVKPDAPHDQGVPAGHAGQGPAARSSTSPRPVGAAAAPTATSTARPRRP